MEVDFTKSFVKQLEKMPVQKRKQVRAAVALFMVDVAAPALRNHKLKGRWLGYSSISAGGDLRLHFKVVTKNSVLFVEVGTHSQLYK